MFTRILKAKNIKMSCSAISTSYVNALKAKSNYAKMKSTTASKNKKWNGTAKQITTTIVNNKPTTKTNSKSIKAAGK